MAQQPGIKAWLMRRGGHLARRPANPALLAVALMAAMALLALALRQRPDGRLHVYFLDVGQGDAILIQTPQGQQILVDGGPSPTALLNQLGQVLPFWDRSLDMVVATHMDSDHTAGLLPLLGRYRVGQALDAPQAGESGVRQAWAAQLAAYRIARQPARRGMQIQAGEVLLTVLHPGARLLAGTPADDNNNSLVLRLEYGQISMLLTGDSEQEAEADMLAAGQPVQANVLKVAHHGSLRSSSAAFLAAVAPRLAIVQVGAGNRFGHPSPQVLQRLAGTDIKRTDLDGRIEVISDGRSLWLSTGRR